MSTIHRIEVLQAQGFTVSAIATELDLDRKTVRK
jgi:DNA-binding NarL/FixJ family response regulator